MPDRIVREGILDSEAVNALSFGAEVFYRRLLSCADDFGRFTANPVLLRARLFAMKLDTVSPQAIREWRAECVKQDLIRLYEVDGKEFLEVSKFNQRLRAKRSKWPLPPGVSIANKQETLNFAVTCQHSADMCPPESESESESSSESHSDAEAETDAEVLTTTTTNGAEALGCKNGHVTPNAGRTSRPPGVPERAAGRTSRSGTRPVVMPEPSPPLLALVDEVLRDFAESTLGKPPQTVVRQVAVALMQSCPHDAEKQFTTLMQAKYDAGHQPQSWRWFTSVVRNAGKEGEFAHAG